MNHRQHENVNASHADSFMVPVAMSRMPGIVRKAAGFLVPLNCRIELTVGTAEDDGRKPVSLEPQLL